MVPILYVMLFLFSIIPRLELFRSDVPILSNNIIERINNNEAENRYLGTPQLKSLSS